MKEPAKPREPTEEDERRKEWEAEARAAEKGVWNPEGPKVRYWFVVDVLGWLTYWRAE